MAAKPKRPLWDAKPSMTPDQVIKRFGAGTSLVKTGKGKWTVKGYDPTHRPARTPPLAPPAPPPGTGLVPRSWAQDGEVIGPWRREPRLSPNEYEWQQNDVGQWYARPRTELTGLNPQQQADIRSADRFAQIGQEGIASTWNTAAQATSNYANAGSAHINALVNAPQAQTVDPTAQAMQANARAGAIPGVAAMQANLALQPGVMAATGAGEAQRFRAGYNAARGQQIQGYRNAQQEAAAAIREQNLRVMLETLGINAQAAATQLNAQTDLAQTGLQVEGQNMRASEAEAGRNARAELAAITAEKDRLTRLTIEERRIAGQIARARENNASAAAIARLERRHKMVGDRRDVQKSRATNMAKWGAEAQRMWDGIDRDVRRVVLVPRGPGQEPEQRTVTQTERTTYSYHEIIQRLITMGAPPAVARKIASQVANRLAPIPGTDTPPGVFRGW